MRLIAFLLLSSAGMCADPVIASRKDNTLVLRYPGGEVELEFTSASAFRVRRGLAGPPRKPITDSKIEPKISTSAQGVSFETNEIRVTVSPRGLITVKLPAGVELYSEEVAAVGEGKARLELRSPASEQFYGGGPRAESAMSARGLVLQPVPPFLVSSRGYAFWPMTPAAFTFDLAKTRAEHVSVEAVGTERLEYVFAYGPSMKEIWEEKLRIAGAPDVRGNEIEWVVGPRLPRGVTGLGTDNLCAAGHALPHASFSGVMLPAIDLSRFRTVDDVTFRRAARLAAFSPVVQNSSGLEFEGAKAAYANEARTMRKRLIHFLNTYADESRSRGYPVVHTLLHQFPRDPEAGRHIDSYMFGDEFLVSPVCDGAKEKQIYLPMGNWTDFNTRKEYRGRQTVTLPVPDDGLILLAKNGSLIPFASPDPKGPTELHYFPRNGGEFFILEPEIGEWTQAHAGPAVDIYRVEIESKVARRYEWVIYHMDKPSTVLQIEGRTYVETTREGVLNPGEWRYDASTRTVRIGVNADAGADIIVNLEFVK